MANVEAGKIQKILMYRSDSADKRKNILKKG